MKKFKPTRTTFIDYRRKLNSVAYQTAHIVDLYSDDFGYVSDFTKLDNALKAYAKTLEPWAVSVARNMIAQTEKLASKRFSEAGARLARDVQDRMKGAVGMISKAIQDEQVGLIKSIPLQAAERAQAIAREVAIGGGRAAGYTTDGEPILSDAAQQIMRLSQDMPESWATRIARTETAKANASIVQAQAQAIGVTHYIWRTAGDGAVRDSHAEMEGQIVAYDNPPTLSDGETHHAGEIYNCRCYQEPILLNDK